MPALVSAQYIFYLPPLLRRATACSFLTAERGSACVLLSLAAARPHVVRKDDERVHEELDCLLLVSHDVQTIHVHGGTVRLPRRFAYLQGSPRHPRATDSSRAPHRPVPMRESDPCPASPSGRRTHGAAPPPCERAAAPAPHSHPAAALAQPRRAGAAPPARPVVSVCSARARPSSRSRNPSRSN